MNNNTNKCFIEFGAFLRPCMHHIPLSLLPVSITVTLVTNLKQIKVCRNKKLMSDDVENL